MTKETTPAARRTRIVSRNSEDKINIVRNGRHTHHISDSYAQLLAAPWKHLLFMIIMVYMATNVIFAIAYMSLGNGIQNARPGSFADAFFFSVQTLSTIGYGQMAPVGTAANLLVTIEVITGFTFFALVTGLMFSKFSRPTARVLFSDMAVIGPHNGKPHLMLRMVNERNNRIVDARVTLSLLRREITQEGMQMRRFHDLDVVRDRLPLLLLSWTIMHPIDEKSPFYGITQDTLEQWEAEIIVSLSGVDETLSQTIYARYSYITEDIIHNASFADIVTRTPDGRLDVNYHLFHVTKPLK